MTISEVTGSAGTVRDALLTAIMGTADFNPGDQVAPVAVLWPDADGAWDAVASALSQDLPVIKLGDFDPDRGTGPVAS